MKKFFPFMVFCFFCGFGCTAEVESSSISSADAFSGGDAAKVEFETKAVRLQQADVANSADQSVDTTPVSAPIDCTTSCDDGKACTDDACDTKTGQCVNTSKGWDCLECKEDWDCKLIVNTCHDDKLWHWDGWTGVCQPDHTCIPTHYTKPCEDDGDPCTQEECGYDEGDEICKHVPIKDCKP